jgi:hypothetical protein
MPLTDPAIRNTKPGGKPVRLFDGGGLYLEVSPERWEMVAAEVSLRWQGKAAVPWRLPQRKPEKCPRAPGCIAQVAG